MRALNSKRFKLCGRFFVVGISGKFELYRTSFHKKRWIFCNGVKLANESVWYKLLYMYTEHSEPTAINCLGYSKNLTIIENFLNMTVSKDSPIPKKSVYRAFNSMLNGDYPNVDVVIDFTANRWDELTAV